MEVFGVSIIEYLGKVDGGILVLIGIVYEDVYYESTFFYDKENILLTISEEMEEKVGVITEHPNYPDLLRSILKQLVPFDELIDSIDPIDFGRWIED